MVGQEMMVIQLMKAGFLIASPRNYLSMGFFLTADRQQFCSDIYTLLGDLEKN